MRTRSRSSRSVSVATRVNTSHNTSPRPSPAPASHSGAQSHRSELTQAGYCQRTCGCAGSARLDLEALQRGVGPLLMPCIRHTSRYDYDALSMTHIKTGRRTCVGRNVEAATHKSFRSNVLWEAPTRREDVHGDVYACVRGVGLGCEFGRCRSSQKLS